ncbi:MAG TPA: hypothetical protein VGJ63_21545 [Micromonosporaceae bacterium]|jgi:hypothetical protein
MAEDKDREEDLRTVAKSRMAHMPAETAGGRLDPAGTSKPSEPSEPSESSEETEAAESADEDRTSRSEDEERD